MPEPQWIRSDVVRAIHLRQLAEHGGDAGVRDANLLESALDRPRNRWSYSEVKPDLAELAAAYAYSLCNNHPFIDGNKRTAYVVLRTFLRLNRFDIDASAPDKYAMVMQLAAGQLTEAACATWIRDHLIEL